MLLRSEEKPGSWPLVHWAQECWRQDCVCTRIKTTDSSLPDSRSLSPPKERASAQARGEGCKTTPAGISTFKWRPQSEASEAISHQVHFLVPVLLPSGTLTDFLTPQRSLSWVQPSQHLVPRNSSALHSLPAAGDK